MFIRIISSIIGFPILAFFIISGGMALKIGILALALIGMHELFAALSINKKPVSVAAYLTAVAYIFFFIDNMADADIVFIISIFIISIMTILVLFHRSANIFEGAAAVFGFFYVCVLLSNIYLVRCYEYGQYLVWLIFISAWGCDTGAYFSGITLGKHKLTPLLSPNKTIEGSVGGVVLATLISFLYGYSIHKIFSIDEIYILSFCTIIGFIGSIFSQFGDLFASSIKRYTGIKDFGHVMPGHGGILDRFDSILFTAPVVYCVVIILFKYTTIH